LKPTCFCQMIGIPDCLAQPVYRGILLLAQAVFFF
jgi:hypothetical protein